MTAYRIYYHIQRGIVDVSTQHDFIVEEIVLLALSEQLPSSAPMYS